MTNFEAKIFNDSARYALLLAEQLQEQAVRDNILKLVRVWLAAARDAEQASDPNRHWINVGSNVTCQGDR